MDYQRLHDLWPRDARPLSLPMTHASSRCLDDGRMTYIARAVRAEHQFRHLMDLGGLAQPDEVEYHETEVVFLWHESKAAVIVELDETSGPAESHGHRGQG